MLRLCENKNKFSKTARFQIKIQKSIGIFI